MVLQRRDNVRETVNIHKLVPYKGTGVNANPEDPATIEEEHPPVEDTQDVIVTV